MFKVFQVRRQRHEARLGNKQQAYTDAQGMDDLSRLVRLIKWWNLLFTVLVLILVVSCLFLFAPYIRVQRS